MIKALPEVLKRWKPASVQEKLALRVLKILAGSGFKQTYFVGGYVRDLFLGITSDPVIDIATQALPKRVARVFSSLGFRVIPTGIKHGTVTVRKGGAQVEVTTFRREGKYEDFRRPNSVGYVGSAKIDASRRDFTINALYFNPVTGVFLDFFGGLVDLKKRRLRFIGSPKARISEDALRLARAVRLATTLDFRLSVLDRQAIKSASRLITKISAERVKLELDKLMLSPRRSFGLRLMLDTGLLFKIIPEMARLAKTQQSNNYHSEGDVFKHTLLALDSLDSNADLTTIYGLLFHDVGKGLTAVRTKKHGRAHVSFHGHQEMGEQLVKKILSRLRFSAKDIADIAWYVRHHHALVDIPKMRVSRQRRWFLEPRFSNLLKIFRADSAASLPTDKYGRKLPADMRLYEYSQRLYRQAMKQPILKKRFVGGLEVMRILKIKPGPKVGQVLELIKERQLQGKIKSKQDALLFLKKRVR